MRAAYFPCVAPEMVSDWFTISIKGDSGKEFHPLEDVRVTVRDDHGDLVVVEIDNGHGVRLTKGAMFEALCDLINVDDLEFGEQA